MGYRRRALVLAALPSCGGLSTNPIPVVDPASLAAERNIPFTGIKNARDLFTASPIISPGRAYRMGAPSVALGDDAETLQSTLGVRTLIDLRSPTELGEDSNLWDFSIYGRYYNSVRWGGGTSTYEIDSRERGDMRGHRTGGSRWFRWRLGRAKDRTLTMVRRVRRVIGRSADHTEKAVFVDDDCCGESEPCTHHPPSRHFVSLMDERKYVVGTARTLPPKSLAKVALAGPAAVASTRAKHKTKTIILDHINGGGLPMLNRLMLLMAGGGLSTVLNLLADKARHPVAFYCTAGKDRTGIISALVLATLGVSDEEIVRDYAVSDNVYAEIGDHKAMVGALKQRDLDPEVFLKAPPEVMAQVLNDIRDEYGGVDGYLDYIGFGKDMRKKLAEALTGEGEDFVREE